MIALSARMRTMLDAHTPSMLIVIADAQGSTPREAGARMLVSASETYGTIGGGQMEFHAIDIARQMLDDGVDEKRLDLSLGPHLGQCCGGRACLAINRLTETDFGHQAADEAQAFRPLTIIFGAGHTGLALAHSLAPLPFRVMLIDDREGLTPDIPANVEFHRIDDPEQAVHTAPASAAAVILTHSHALDYALADAALRRGDFASVGMIGSATKRARFRQWFRARGGDEAALARLVCPVGGADIRDKRPEVIAALTSVELLHRYFAANRAETGDPAAITTATKLNYNDFAA